MAVKKRFDLSDIVRGDSYDDDGEVDGIGKVLVVELKKGESSDIILNNLYQQTQLQNSFPITMLCIVNGRPRRMTIIEILKEFIGFRREVVTRRTLFHLHKAEDRHHILMGLRIALDYLDSIIILIRTTY